MATGEGGGVLPGRAAFAVARGLAHGGGEGIKGQTGQLEVEAFGHTGIPHRAVSGLRWLLFIFYSDTVLPRVQQTVVVHTVHVRAICPISLPVLGNGVSGHEMVFQPGHFRIVGLPVDNLS